MTSPLYRQLLALAGAALLAAPGCSALKGSLNQENLNELDGSKTFAILYRTESDRLNVAGSGGSGGVRQVSYQGSAGSLLPPVSLSTLKIMYPHPEGRPDYARAFVAFSPLGEDSATESQSFWTRLTGWGANSPEDPPRPFEVRALDVPKYQIDGIVAKLQEAHFFRRSKVLASKTYLGVSLDGKGFGKNYRNVDELDALIVRVRQQGWPVGRDGKPLQGRRLLPPRQQPGVYQTQAERPLPPHCAATAYRRQPVSQPQPPQRHADYPGRFAQPQHGQPPYSQPTVGPTSYEQPKHDRQYSQPTDQQPQYRQPPNGQPRYDMPGYMR